MSPAGFVRGVFDRDKPLAWTGAWMLLQAALFVVLMPFDDRTILGIDPWVKPFKFCVSVGIFLWTLAWFLPLLRISARLRGFLSWSFSLLMIVEVGCIVLQSVRGTRSHFNFETGFDASVFSVMGLLIALNSVLLGTVLVLFFFRPGDLRGTYLWGIRLGLLVTLLGSCPGGLDHRPRAARRRGRRRRPRPAVRELERRGGRPARLAHDRPARHADPADFRVLLGRWKPSWPESQSRNALFSFTAIYVLVGAAFLAQALAGVPFIAG